MYNAYPFPRGQIIPSRGKMSAFNTGQYLIILRTEFFRALYATALERTKLSSLINTQQLFITVLLSENKKLFD